MYLPATALPHGCAPTVMFATVCGVDTRLKTAAMIRPTWTSS
jgi:hypothetical protein